MPDLKSGGSRHSQFVDYQRVPSFTAEADTSAILAAYTDGLAALLSLCGQEGSSQTILAGMYEAYTTFRTVREMIGNELAKADVMLDAIEAKLAI